MNRSLIVILFPIMISLIGCLVGCQRYSELEAIKQIKALQTKIMNERDSSKRESITAQYYDVVETNPHGVVMTTMAGDVLEANQAYQDILGYTLTELRDLTYQEITPPKWHEMEQKIVSEAMNKEFVHFEKEYVKKGGAIFAIDITGWIIKDDDSEPIGTGSIVKPITQ